MVAAAALIAAVATVVALLKARAEGDTYSFLNGMSLGLLATLPAGMGYLLFRAYRQMDEFGQRQQERACAFAFLLTMAARDGGVRGDELYQYRDSAVGGVRVRHAGVYGGGGARRSAGEGGAGVTQAR